MINVNNQFQDNNLNIEFSGDSIDTKEITISVSNDVNFKPVIDHLIQLIPTRLKLTLTFEDFSQEDNTEKLDLIKETVSGIYDKFNLSIDYREELESTAEETTENSSSDDLTF